MSRRQGKDREETRGRRVKDAETRDVIHRARGVGVRVRTTRAVRPRACVCPRACVRARVWRGIGGPFASDRIGLSRPAPSLLLCTFRTRCTCTRIMIINPEADWPTGQRYRVPTAGPVPRPQGRRECATVLQNGVGFFFSFQLFAVKNKKNFTAEHDKLPPPPSPPPVIASTQFWNNGQPSEDPSKTLFECVFAYKY